MSCKGQRLRGELLVNLKEARIVPGKLFFMKGDRRENHQE